MKRLSRKLPNASYQVVADSRHYIQLDQQQAIIDAIRQLVKRLHRLLFKNVIPKRRAETGLFVKTGRVGE